MFDARWKNGLLHQQPMIADFLVLVKPMWVCHLNPKTSISLISCKSAPIKYYHRLFFYEVRPHASSKTYVPHILIIFQI